MESIYLPNKWNSPYDDMPPVGEDILVQINRDKIAIGYWCSLEKCFLPSGVKIDHSRCVDCWAEVELGGHVTGWVKIEKY